MIRNIPTWRFLLCVGHLCELLAQPVRRGRQETGANHWLAAVPCPSLCSCGWAKSSLMQYRKIKIPNKTKLCKNLNPSQIHECKNWELGRTVSFLGIYFWNFCYSVSSFLPNIFEGMRSSRVVRAYDCQCQSRNSPGFDPSILRHNGIWGAADEAMLNKAHAKTS
jgi:hypothetical protein